MERKPRAARALGKALSVLEDGLMDATAVLALPDKYRCRLRTTNEARRFIEEIRRREKVIQIFPNIEAAHRLVGLDREPSAQRPTRNGPLVNAT